MFRTSSIAVIFGVLSSVSQADNILTDSFLQPYSLANHPSHWALSAKYGYKEGSGEIENDGFRLEIPRLTLQKNVNNQILFRASVPYNYLNSSELTRFAIGDPSFITSLQLNPNQTFTVGVTEPAANRPLEPDVVRFFAFVTRGFEFKVLKTALQVGTEIPDRYAQKGQDDILSFGAKIQLNEYPLEINLIRKQVVDGKWWDVTRPLSTPLNRTNITLAYQFNIPHQNQVQLKSYASLQYNTESQLLFGLEIAFK